MSRACIVVKLCSFKNVHDFRLCREYYQLELVVFAYLFIIWSPVVHVTIWVFMACLSCNCQLELVALLTCSVIWSFVVDVNTCVFRLVCPAIASWNLWRCLLVHKNVHDSAYVMDTTSWNLWCFAYLFIAGLSLRI